MAYEKLELLINGKWRQGGSNKSEPVYNPATSETIGDLPHASKADLDEALDAVCCSFLEPGESHQPICLDVLQIWFLLLQTACYPAPY